MIEHLRCLLLYLRQSYKYVFCYMAFDKAYIHQTKLSLYSVFVQTVSHYENSMIKWSLFYWTFLQMFWAGLPFPANVTANRIFVLDFHGNNHRRWSLGVQMGQSPQRKLNKNEHFRAKNWHNLDKNKSHEFHLYITYSSGWLYLFFGRWVSLTSPV